MSSNRMALYLLGIFFSLPAWPSSSLTITYRGHEVALTAPQAALIRFLNQQPDKSLDNGSIARFMGWSPEQTAVKVRGIFLAINARALVATGAPILRQEIDQGLSLMNWKSTLSAAPLTPGARWVCEALELDGFHAASSLHLGLNELSKLGLALSELKESLVEINVQYQNLYGLPLIRSLCFDYLMGGHCFTFDGQTWETRPACRGARRTKCSVKLETPPR